MITEEEKKDKNIFKQIIEENWEDFKKYNKPYYEEVIKRHCYVGQSREDIRSIDVWNADRG